jgi:hypothetical protein
LTLAGAVLGAQVAYDADSAGDAFVDYNGTHLDTGVSEPTPFENRDTGSEGPTDPILLDDSYVFDSTGFESYGKRFTDRLIDTMVSYAAWVADSSATVLYPLSDVLPRSVTVGILNLLTVFWFGFMGYRVHRRSTEASR